MDAREGHSQNKCDMCSQKGHNRKTCQNEKRMWIGLNLTKCYVVFHYV